MNKEILEYFDRAIKKEKIFQSYLFCGPKETGKFEVVEFLRESLLKNKNNYIQVDCEEGKNEITIKQIRELLKSISYKEERGERKLVVIKEAQKMNVAAANSLLKALEEPNELVIFILLTNREESIIPTIQSRCHKIFFNLKKAEDIEEYLRGKFSGKKKSLLKESAIFSKGKYKLAEKIVKDPKLFQEKKDEFREFQRAIKGSWSDGLNLAEIMANKKECRDEIIEKIEYWIWSLMDYLKSDLAQKEDKKVHAKLHSLITNLLELKKRIEKSNANEKLQLENFFIQSM